MPTHSLPWWGLTSVNDKERLERFENKLMRIGYLEAIVAHLFPTLLVPPNRSIERNANHVLTDLLPP